MNFFEELTRVTDAHLDNLKIRPQGNEPFPQWGRDLTIPVFLRKPTSGPCVHCGYDTEDKRDGEWLHDGCNDELVGQQAEDHRLDDPRHGQARYLNRG